MVEAILSWTERQRFFQSTGTCVRHLQQDSNLYIKCCEPWICGFCCVLYCCMSLVVLLHHACGWAVEWVAVEPPTVVVPARIIFLY